MRTAPNFDTVAPPPGSRHSRSPVRAVVPSVLAAAISGRRQSHHPQLHWSERVVTGSGRSRQLTIPVTGSPDGACAARVAAGLAERWDDAAEGMPLLRDVSALIGRREQRAFLVVFLTFVAEPPARFDGAGIGRQISCALRSAATARRA